MSFVWREVSDPLSNTQKFIQKFNLYVWQSNMKTVKVPEGQPERGLQIEPPCNVLYVH